MYVVGGQSVGDYLDPQAVAQGSMPRTPQTASMVLPRGSYFVSGGAMPGTGGFSDLGETNWAQWGQDMLQQGIKDTTGAVSYMANRSGRTDTRTPAGTTPAATAPVAQEAALVPVAPMVVEKKGLPGWAWALIAVGGAAVLGGGVYFVFFRKKG